MRSIVYFFISLFYIVFSQANQVSTDTDKFFVIIIPSYNNAQWYQKNLDSVLCQTYQNYRVIYIDDASSDDTANLVEKHLFNHDHKNKILLIKNKERRKALVNIYDAIWSCKPYEIIVILDGDDWFADKNVLSYLNTIYANENVWLTYEQYRRWPSGIMGHCKQIPQHIIDGNLFRDYEWVSSHLRTFYATLFQQIKKDDLLYNGDFFPMAWDLAFMFPMLEMAGNHSKFISKVLNSYNRANLICDDKVNRTLQLVLEQEVRNRIRYLPKDAILSSIILKK